VASNRRGASRARAAVVALPVRRPAGRVRSLLPSGRSVVVGLGLVALAVGTYALARSTSAFAVEEIRVEGTTPAVARQVRAALEQDAGSSLLALDRDLVARLEALPDVRTAVYDRAFPHTLVVRVERELPAAVLRRGRESWLLSERGRVLRSLPRGRHPRLPRVWVAGGRPLEPGEVLRRPAVAQSMLVVRGLPPDFPLAVRSVAVTNGVALLVLAGGLEVRLGAPRDVPLKLAVAAAILPSLARRAEGGPDYLDVSVPERSVSGLNPQVGGEG
jgi:cell division septal protein FtsQ